MTAKTTYTLPEIVKRSTTQLIAMYNRIFNSSAWDEWFNPYEARQEMILALWVEMRAQEIVAQFSDESTVEPYKALKIVVSADGMAIIWNTGEIKTGNRKVTDEQMRVIRQLHADGETHKWIAEATHIPQITVFRVLKGAYAIEETRWNKDRKPAKTTTFSAQRQTKQIFTTSNIRTNDAFWTNFGL